MEAENLASGTGSTVTAPTDSSLAGASPWAAILWGTLIAGAADIAAAILWWGVHQKAGVVRILQSVARGAFGRAAFDGGAGTAGLGLLFHFVIMGVIVTLYVLAARRLAVLTRRPIVCGVAYGLIVYLVMTCIVVPSSAVGGPRIPGLSSVLPQLGFMIFCCGLPIAFVTRRLLAR